METPGADNRKYVFIVVIALLAAALLVGGCVSLPPPAGPAPLPSAAATYSDPFAYCAAVGTVDAPDARYTGPKTPAEVVPAPTGATQLPPFPEGSVFWRCMGGQMYTCVVGANIPCWDKADTSTTPNAGMVAFCKEQPNADVIPAAAAGRDTVYDWSCKAGAPVRGKQVLQVDAQGYVVQYWERVVRPGGG